MFPDAGRNLMDVILMDDRSIMRGKFTQVPAQMDRCDPIGLRPLAVTYSRHHVARKNQLRNHTM